MFTVEFKNDLLNNFEVRLLNNEHLTYVFSFYEW